MAGELDPRTRKEVFLSGMLYGDPEDLPDPETRDELFMKAIAETIKEGGVPSPEGADVGDVLTIGADGPEWAAPSGGDIYKHIWVYEFSNSDGHTSFTLTHYDNNPVASLDFLYDTDSNNLYFDVQGIREISGIRYLCAVYKALSGGGDLVGVWVKDSWGGEQNIVNTDIKYTATYKIS